MRRLFLLHGLARFLWSHRVPASLVTASALVIVVWVGWTLGSPIFTNTTVYEAFTFAVASPGPSDTDGSPVAETVPVVVAKTPTVQTEITPVVATAGLVATEEPTSSSLLDLIYRKSISVTPNSKMPT